MPSDTATPDWGECVKLGWIKTLNALNRLLFDALRHVFFAPLEWPDAESDIRRILVFRIGNVGDILINIPTLSAIRQRFPNAHICLLTSPGSLGAPGAKDLLPVGKWFDELWVYHNTDIATWKGSLALLNRIRSRKYDLWIELSEQLTTTRRELRHLLMARLAGCRFAVGFQASCHRTFARTQMLYCSQYQEVERIYASVAEELHLGSPGPLRLPVPDDERRAVRELLHQCGASDDQPFIVMHVGAKRSTNRWFETRYASVADAIQKRYGLQVVLTGSPSECSQVEQVVQIMQTQALVLCGQTTLLQLAALLERACLYVGNDTGPMHIAAAVGTPTVSIFSARDFPKRWYPYGDGHIVLRRDVSCSPCFKEVCDQGLICLERITVEDVLHAVEQQLSYRVEMLREGKREH